MIQLEVPHVADTNQFETASVRSENLVTSHSEDSYMPDLGPSVQVPEPTALAEVSDQVYETILCKEVLHSLVTWAPHLA